MGANGHLEAARALHRRAVEVASAARPAEAVRLLRRALRTLPVASTEFADISLRTRILVSLAYTQAETGPVADGLVQLGTASALVNGLPDDRRPALLGLINKQHGLILLRAGRTSEAVDLFDQAIPMLEQADDTAGLINPLMNRGLAYILMGRPVAAEQDMRRCMELAIRHEEPVLEAKARSNLGDIALLSGDVPGAVRHYESAERTFRELAPGLVPRTQIDLARALLAAGLVDEAARPLDEALPRLRAQRIGQDLAEAELTRAAAALLQGDLDNARELASSAHRRFLRRGSEPWAEVAALTGMRADVTAVLSGRTRSRVNPARAAALAERLAAVGLTDEAAMATMLAVRLALHRGAPDTARELLTQVPTPRKLTPIDHKLMLRLCRAELAVATGNKRAALAQARAGLAELGAARDRMGGLDLVSGTALHGIELGALAVRLVLRDVRTQADARRLLAWQERTRAQVYRYEPLPSIEDPVLAERVAELRTVLRVVAQHRVDGRPTAELERRSAALQREVSRLGWYTSPWGRPRPVCTPDQIVDALGERALISYTSPDDTLGAVVVSGGRTKLVRLAERAEVLEVAKQLHADLNALAPDHLLPQLAEVVSDSARRRIARLDELLTAPLADLIGDREVVVVPFDSLYSVPWGSLPTLHKRALSVAPSATAWVRAARPAGGTDGGVVLVVGPGLPDALTELTRLRALYPGAVVLDGDRATTGAVLAAMDGAKLAHIAAHGTHEPANALFSRLELADGALLAHEIAGLNRPPEHVVLAACELALSHIRPGDEALGFAGATLASGSRTVIAAVTRVGDQATAETMTDYHRHLAGGFSPASALAAATGANPLRRPFICLGAG